MFFFLFLCLLFLCLSQMEINSMITSSLQQLGTELLMTFWKDFTIKLVTAEIYHYIMRKTGRFILMVKRYWWVRWLWWYFPINNFNLLVYSLMCHWQISLKLYTELLCRNIWYIHIIYTYNICIYDIYIYSRNIWYIYNIYIDDIYNIYIHIIHI